MLKCCPNPTEVSPLPLPSSFVGNQPLLTPLAILDHRKIRRQNSWISQVLVEWTGIPLEETSWEDFNALQQMYPDLHLEDKVLSEEEGNDTVLIQ